MNNVADSMIELNIHMQRRGYADALIALGGILLLLSIIFFMLDFAALGKIVRYLIPYIVTMILGLAILLFGLRIPKDKIISYCANKPVSIGQISAAYDILEIDGKLIKLKERR